MNLPKASELRGTYMNAWPFPHIVLKDVFDIKEMREIVEDFPKKDDKHDVEYRGEHEHKDVTHDRLKLSARANAFIDRLNSKEFCAWLNELTGIEESLIPDHKLFGGGFHSSPRGGFLKLHADFNKHYETGFDRRVNLLLYLNEDWKEEYGGHVELWPEELEGDYVSVLPEMGTIVIFSTTDYSYHGHPDPNKCPEGVDRKSLAMYYYSNGRPSNEIDGKPHNSLWKPRKGIDNFDELDT